MGMLAILRYGSPRARPAALVHLVIVALAVTSGAAFAQNGAPPASANAPPPPPSGENAAPASPQPAPSGSANAPNGTAPADTSTLASKGALTGYAYKAHSPAYSSDASAPRHHLLAHHANEAVATFTGFEMLADGGSRVFVQLSRQVEVGEGTAEAPEKMASAPHAGRKGKKAHAAPATAGVVSRREFVLKGAEVVNPNNERALVTVHFNTPVVRARLVPAGRDLHLMVELRADVTPQMKIVPAKDNGAMLQIDFPQGSYLPQGDAEPAAASPGPAGAAAPAALPSTAAGADESKGPQQ